MFKYFLKLAFFIIKRRLDTFLLKHNIIRMYLANFISATRIFLSPLFFLLYFRPSYFFISSKQAILILAPLFIALQFTDFLDGFIARKFHIVSDFGKLFDPFCDVILNIVVLFSFTLDGLLPPMFFLVILYREFFILFVRLLAMKKGLVIGAKMLGKIKTVLYILVGGIGLAFKISSIYEFDNILKPLHIANTLLYSSATFFSILSFSFYLKDYLKFSKEHHPI